MIIGFKKQFKINKNSRLISNFKLCWYDFQNKGNYFRKNIFFFLNVLDFKGDYVNPYTAKPSQCQNTYCEENYTTTADCELKQTTNTMFNDFYSTKLKSWTKICVVFILKAEKAFSMQIIVVQLSEVRKNYNIHLLNAGKTSVQNTKAPTGHNTN